MENYTKQFDVNPKANHRNSHTALHCTVLHYEQQIPTELQGKSLGQNEKSCLQIRCRVKTANYKPNTCAAIKRPHEYEYERVSTDQVVIPFWQTTVKCNVTFSRSKF